MESALTDAIRAALTEVRDPQTGLDVVSAGWVQGLVARDGLVQ
ncbi:iron-sulfur cluster assembly protein, partial [Roseomonas sp. DSM 102946]|nr:iron-sulfur cluster assembly protein [Roseomonas sp. DSM 102946]